MTVGTIALFYGHVASNIGDAAINRGEIVLLRQAFPKARIRVILLNGKQSAHLPLAKTSFESEGEVEFTHFAAYDSYAPRYALDPGRFLDECGAGDADLVVLAAGEHLFQYADYSNHKNLFWRSLPAFAARERGRRCLIMPSTFGPFEDRQASDLVAALFATKPAAAVRDAQSAAIVRKAAAEAPLHVGLDPAFFIPLPALSAARRVPQGKRVFGLVMRSEGWGLRLAKAERVNITQRFEGAGYRSSLAYRFSVSFIEKALAAGASLRMVVQTAADEALSEAIIDRFADTPESARISLVAPKSVDEYLQAIAAVDGVVASRFHGLVLAMVAGRPCFGAYFGVHGHKTPGLFELLGRPDLCVDLSRSDVEASADTALAALSTDGNLLSMLEGRIDGLRRDTLDWLNADWNASSSLDQHAGLTLECIRPLGRIAAELARKAVRVGPDRRKRLAAVEARVFRLRNENERLKTESRVQAGKLRESERLRAESLAELQDAWTRVAAQARESGRSEKKHRRQLDRAAASRRELVERVKALEQSESFRIGSAIVRAATAPRRLVERFRGPRLALRADDYDAVTAPPIDFEPLLTLYRTSGQNAVIADLRNQFGHDVKALGNALIQASRAIADAGFTAAESFALVSEAAHVDRCDQTLRALYWAAHRSGRVREAWDCLTEIEALCGPHPTSTQAQWMEKARKGPIMNLALLREVVPAAGTPFEPRTGRICYVLHNSLPYSSGGYATRTHGLARGLRATGIETLCISRPGFPFDVTPDLESAELPVEDVVEGIRYLRAWQPRRASGTALGPYVRGAADVFEAQFRMLKPSLILAASAHLSALPALIAAKRLGLPFVYEVRGFWEITRVSRDPGLAEKPYFHVQKQLEAGIADRADHVFTLTASMREELIARGVSGEKITLLPNSCDPERFTPRSRDDALAARLGIPAHVPVIGYVGTFVQYEGLEDLTRACALLRSRGAVFRLMLVGNENTSGSDRGRITKDIERIAAEQGLAEWLIMPGRVPHEEVEAYYSLIDIAPFPRKPQPVTEMVSPMKPLEAMAMQKAVVVSSVGALAEMVSDGETGLVFEKGSVESLAEVLVCLIGDSELRARLGRAARDWVVRERTWGATAARACTEIDRLCSAWRIRRPVVADEAIEAEQARRAAEVLQKATSREPIPVAQMPDASQTVAAVVQAAHEPVAEQPEPDESA
ncbi:MAG: glycosyltransferase, partial [Steroidobacteraceae bacterium]